MSDILTKDKNHLENYYAASAGYKEFKGKSQMKFQQMNINQNYL